MRILIVFGLFVASALPSQALTIIQCNLAATQHNWVSRALVIAFEPGASSGIVADEVGLYFTGKPATARISSNGGRVKFSWKVPNIRDGRGNLVSSMIYRGTLSGKASKVAVSAEPLGYSARFSSRGTCRPLPDSERQAFQSLIDRSR